MSPQKWIKETNAIGIISKVNYLVHTDAVKTNIVPILTEEQKNMLMQKKQMY